MGLVSFPTSQRRSSLSTLSVAPQLFAIHGTWQSLALQRAARDQTRILQPAGVQLVSGAVGMGLLLLHIPPAHLLGSRKYVPLHLGVGHCAQVPEGLAVGDQSSVLRCWAGAMSRPAFACPPDKQQGCSGASQTCFSPVAGPHVHCGAPGWLHRTGNLWVS